MTKETLIKTQSPRSKQRIHAADCVTLRFNQRFPKDYTRNTKACLKIEEMTVWGRKDDVSDFSNKA